jgi:hypothetical protein
MATLLPIPVNLFSTTTIPPISNNRNRNLFNFHPKTSGLKEFR